MSAPDGYPGEELCTRVVTAVELAGIGWAPTALRAELRQVTMDGAFMAEMLDMLRVLDAADVETVMVATQVAWALRGGPKPA